MIDFYSRPCGRGDFKALPKNLDEIISTHAPAGGATEILSVSRFHGLHFYSRPCGRGDRPIPRRTRTGRRFLLTPLREGRREAAIKNRNIGYISTHAPAGGATGRGRPAAQGYQHISTHAPAGGATQSSRRCIFMKGIFLLTPLREGRHSCRASSYRVCRNFYSRPCGRGDPTRFSRPNSSSSISTHAPAGGATPVARVRWLNLRSISTHAPAGGATRACVIIFVPVAFLLTPLREGRLHDPGADQDVRPISTHAPAGGATPPLPGGPTTYSFLLTPLREGRRDVHR